MQQRLHRFTIATVYASVRIERIVSNNHASPDNFWYDWDRHEWVVVLKGAATLRFEDGTIEMQPSDQLPIIAATPPSPERTTSPVLH